MKILYEENKYITIFLWICTIENIMFKKERPSFGIDNRWDKKKKRRKRKENKTRKDEAKVVFADLWTDLRPLL